MKKICFIGAPSTGKTVLAKFLTENLKRRGYTAELAKEYARDFILKRGSKMKADDQLAILYGQKEREKTAAQKNPEFVVCDCATFLAYVYSFLYKPSLDQKEEVAQYETILKRIKKEIESEIDCYDYIFFLPPEIPPEKDGVRLYTKERDEISNQIKKFLIFRNIKYYEIKGSVEKRMERVLKLIK